MAISLKRTGALAQPFVKVLIPGESGAGKTRACAQLEDVVFLSAEEGLLSIRDSDKPYIEIRGLDDLYEAYSWLTSSDEAKQFSAVAIDSISEIAEVVLSSEKKRTKDPRAAYGEMQDKIAGVIRAFRDLSDRHVVMTAKMEKGTTENGEVRQVGSMPGKKLTADLPYYFDEVLPVRVHRVGESVTRAFQCVDDGIWHAKDRSGRLDAWEPYDLAALIKKIGGVG